MTWLTDNLILYEEFLGLLVLLEREGLRKMGLAPCEVWGHVFTGKITASWFASCNGTLALLQQSAHCKVGLKERELTLAFTKTTENVQPRRVKKGKQRQCNDSILMLKVVLISVVVQ